MRVVHLPAPLKTQVGTPMFMAPEMWLQRGYDWRVDIWALGCLLYYVLTQKVCMATWGGTFKW